MRGGTPSPRCSASCPGAGIARESVTVLVAGGLERRPGRRELESLLRPDQRRDFRGAIVVHDCEADDLRPVVAGGRPTRVHPTLVETDLIVTVGAGESVLHGGATALVDASVPGTMRAARTVSLLEANGAAALQIGAALEAELGRAVPIIGLSLVLDRPRTTGLYRGYPWRPEAIDGGGPLAVPATAQRVTRRAAAPRAHRRAP